MIGVFLLAIAAGCMGLGSEPLDDVVEVAAGGFHTCARDGDGVVFCWGMNNARQVTAEGGTGGVARPVRVDGLSAVRLLALGSHHSCAVEQGGTMMCWGKNNAGQLGDGTQQSRPHPTPVDFDGNVAQISASSVYTCVRTEEGRVWCTGALPSAVNRRSTVLTPLDGLTDVIDLSVTNTHGCAVHQGGTVSCWGSNLRGELGDGTTEARAAPAPVPGLTGVVQVSTGERRTCARMEDGTVRCWGYEAGPKEESPHPIPIPGLQDVVEIGLGEFHQCARHADGTISCWGSRFWSQLGDGRQGWGNDRHQETPVRVLDIDNAVQLTVGGRHSCARLAGGVVTCWGDNVGGALGVGEDSERAYPMVVP